MSAVSAVSAVSETQMRTYLLPIPEGLQDLKLTAHDWYLNFAKFKIMDADGWKNEDCAATFWYMIPITYKEFVSRYIICTLGYRRLPGEMHYVFELYDL